MGTLLTILAIIGVVVYLAGFVTFVFLSNIILDLPVRKPLMCVIIGILWPIVLSAAIYNGNVRI